MKIERTEKEIIVGLPNSGNTQKIQATLDLIRYKEIAADSVATQEDVDEPSDEMKSNWWSENKHRFVQ